jgi:hypothetical protein
LLADVGLTCSTINRQIPCEGHLGLTRHLYCRKLFSSNSLRCDSPLAQSSVWSLQMRGYTLLKGRRHGTGSLWSGFWYKPPQLKNAPQFRPGYLVRNSVALASSKEIAALRDRNLPTIEWQNSLFDAPRGFKVQTVPFEFSGKIKQVGKGSTVFA